MSEPTPDDIRFEDALAELEQVVRDLEDGQVGLEESLARYERGVGLIKGCYAQLRDAEQRILLVTGTDDEGKPILQPFQHAATSSGGRSQGPGVSDPPKPTTALRARRLTTDPDR
jgi:exodeoxyribonuclease VII small subunit